MAAHRYWPLILRPGGWPAGPQVERSVSIQEHKRQQIARATAGLFESSPRPMWIYDPRTLSAYDQHNADARKIHQHV